MKLENIKCFDNAEDLHNFIIEQEKQGKITAITDTNIKQIMYSVAVYSK